MQEFTDLVLCRDVFHCTPQELDDIPADVLERYLIALDVEAKANRSKVRLDTLDRGGKK